MKTVLMLVQDYVNDNGWPEGAVCAVQDSNGELKFISDMPSNDNIFGYPESVEVIADRDGHWWYEDEDVGDNCYKSVQSTHYGSAEDCRTAIITPDMLGE